MAAVAAPPHQLAQPKLSTRVASFSFRLQLDILWEQVFGLQNDGRLYIHTRVVNERGTFLAEHKSAFMHV